MNITKVVDTLLDTLLIILVPMFVGAIIFGGIWGIYMLLEQLKTIEMVKTALIVVATVFAIWLVGMAFILIFGKPNDDN